MVARSTAAPPNPWSKTMVNPKVHSSAYVHSFAQVLGNVNVGQNALVAPGASVRSDGDAVVLVGESCTLQEGAIVHGVKGGRVLGEDGQPYSVWIGARSLIAHKAVIHSPAFVGEGCFIGCRSTLFNVRLGKGCIVMMHALVQDVEIPDGKYVPSGAVITDQHQADSLSDVQPADQALVREILGEDIDLLHSGYSKTAKTAKVTPVQAMSQQHSDLNNDTRNHYNKTYYATEQVGRDTMPSQRLAPDVVQQVRQFLHQGYRIGAEHADQRRYRSGVWQPCTPIQSNREGDVFAALEACIAEHAGEYVRILGIDPVAKKRVGTLTIQRGDGKPVVVNRQSTPAASAPASGYGGASYGNGGTTATGLSPELVQQVRSLIHQGYRIGTEHADKRRFRSGVWKTCSPIQSTRESEVIAALEGCLAEHQGEYVRMFGIDPVAKRRVSPTTIQRGDGKPASVQGGSNSGMGAPAAAASGGQPVGTVSGDLAQQVRSILAQGCKVGVEYADQRRYRSGVWQTAPAIQASSESGVMNGLQAFLSQNGNAYVRIFGINPQMKQRMAAVTIQKPGQAPKVASPSAASATSNSSYGNGGYGSNGNGAVPQSLGSDIAQQITQLINQGYRISTEYADKRRYRSGAWQAGAPIQASRPSDAIAALESQLGQHVGEYVRLVGVDPRAKRRVLETTIQRP